MPGFLAWDALRPAREARGHESCDVQMSRGGEVNLGAAGDSCRGPCPDGETTPPGGQA